MCLFSKNKFKYLCILLVFTMMFSAVTVKAAETQIPTLSFDTPTQVSITSINDVKYFKINISTPGALRINCTSIPASDMGLSYTLYKDLNGTPDTSSPIDTAEVKDSRGYTLDRSTKVSSGTYYIALAGISYYDQFSTFYKGWSDKSFTLSATLFDAENNDTSSTALEITSIYNADPIISAANDVDWYKITVNQNSSLKVFISNLPSSDMGFSYVVYKDLNGTPDTTSPIDKVELKDYRTTTLERSSRVSPGTYYIKLSGISYSEWYYYKGWSDKSFKLNVTVFDAENNDTSSTALEVTSGYNGTPIISSPKDSDWYKINVSESGSLRVIIGNLPSDEMGFSYEVYKELNGVPDTSSPIDKVELKDYRIITLDRSSKVSPGIYYIKLSGISYTSWYYYKGWSDKSFKLNVTVFDTENNDTSSTALEISSGYSGTPIISSLNDSDWYKINVNEISSLHVMITNLPSSDMGFSYEVYKELNGAPDTSSPIDKVELKNSRSYSIDRSNKISPGTYYIKLSGIAYSDYYTYKGWSDKNFNFYVHVFDPENNDASSTATVVSSGTTLNPNISFPNDEDWYKITTTDIGTFRIQISNIPTSEMGFNYVLYEEKDGVVNTSSPLDSFEVAPGSSSPIDRVIRLTPGTYYIKTTGKASSGYYSYKGWSDKSFNITFTIFDIENNDAKENATKLQNDTEVTGFASVPGDIDWYLMDVPQNSILNLTLSDSGAYVVDYIIYRLDTDGSLKEQAKNGFEVTPGKYYIKVTSRYDNYWSPYPYKIKIILNNKLQAINKNSYISLNWDAVPNSTSYTIMKKEGTGEYQVLKTLGGNITTYADYDVKTFVEYTYYIKAEGGLINTSITSSATPSKIHYIIYKSNAGIRYENLDTKESIILTSSTLDYYFDTSKQKLYYISSDGLHSVNIDGTSDSLLISGLDSKAKFDISPDGNKILYVKDGVMYYSDDKGQNSTAVLSNYPTVTDVKWLYRNGTLGYSYVIDEKLYAFVENLVYSVNKNSFISPDGSKVIEIRQESDGKHIYLINKITNTETSLKVLKEYSNSYNGTYNGAYSGPIYAQWTPDGEKVALQTDWNTWSRYEWIYHQSVTVDIDLYDGKGSKISTIYNNKISEKDSSGLRLDFTGDYLVIKNSYTGMSYVKYFDSDNVWMTLKPDDYSGYNIIPVTSKQNVVYAKEDVNQDGIVDIKDIAAAARYYNIKQGASGWDSKFDLNTDSIIDVYDLVTISKKYN